MENISLEEVEIEGNLYRALNLGGMDQGQLFRKILPFIMPMLVNRLKKLNSSPVDMALMMMQQFAEMPRATYEEVVMMCLARVMRKSGDKWQYVVIAGKLNFEDIDGPTLNELMMISVNRNIMDHLDRFTRALLVMMPRGTEGGTSA